MAEDASLIDDFVRTRGAILAAADSVPAASRETPFVGHWHLMDLLAHLIGWDYANIEAIEALEAGRTPAFYGHYDPGWAAYNRQLVERYGTEDWQALRRSIDASREAIVLALRSLPPGALRARHPLADRERPVSIAGILRAAIRDEREHLAQIEAFAAWQHS
jgi:hypothetical protein